MKMPENINKKNVAISAIYIALILIVFTAIDLIYSMINKNYHYGMTRYLPIMIISIALIPKPKLKLGLYILMLTMSFVQLVHFEYFGSLLRAIEFYSLFLGLNDVKESFFASLHILIVPSILILSAFFIIFFIHKKFKDIIISPKHFGKLLIVLLTLFIINDVMIVYKTNNKLYSKSSKMIYPISGDSSAFNIFKTLNYFAIGILPKKIMGNHGHFKSLSKPKLAKKSPDVNVIFIIGETLRAKNVSFLGYKKNHTTPLLENLFKEKPNNTFQNWVYSGGTMSKTSIAVLTNRLKYPGTMEQVVKKENCIFNLAKTNNFYTVFASSQYKEFLSIVHTLVCNDYLDENFARDDIPSKVKNSTGQDEDLLSLLKQVDLEGKSNLITYQMVGSHSPYETRYPKKWDKFKSTFDNTVLYSDFVLTSMIKYILNNVKKTTYFVYVSDHGELLHEKGRNGHGWFEPEVYMVPFVFASNKPIPESLQNDLKNIKSHYEISTLVTKLLGYDVEIQSMKEKTIYVNGSDLDALGGFLRIDIKDGKKVSLKKNN